MPNYENTDLLSSGLLTGTVNVVLNKRGKLYGLLLHPGSAASSVQVLDGPSGTLIASALAPANSATVFIPLPGAIIFKIGLNVVVAGTGAFGEVHYFA